MVRYKNLSAQGKKKRRKVIGKSAIAVASTALAVARGVASLINVEFKVHDLNSSLNPSSTGGALLLTGIVQGDGPSNRDGNSVKTKSLEVKYYLKKHVDATQTSVRLLWVLDTVGTITDVPTATKVLESVDTISMRNLDYKNRFVILKDKVYSLGDHTMAHGTYYKKFNMETSFTDTTASSYSAGHLWLIYLSNEATNYPDLLIRHRLRFLDN